MKEILLLNLFLLCLIVTPVGSRTDISQFSRCADDWRWRSTSGKIQLQFSDDDNSVSVIRIGEIPVLTVKTLQQPRTTRVPDLSESSDSLDTAQPFQTQVPTQRDAQPPNLTQTETLPLMMQPSQVNGDILEKSVLAPDRQIRLRIRQHSKTFSNALMNTLRRLSEAAGDACDD